MIIIYGLEMLDTSLTGTNVMVDKAFVILIMISGCTSAPTIRELKKTLLLTNPGEYLAHPRAI